jgi:hypothetical protein
MLRENYHYPAVRSYTVTELCDKYAMIQRQYWISKKLFTKHGCNEIGMTVYAEYMKVLWDEIERRIDDELELGLIELIYMQLPL